MHLKTTNNNSANLYLTFLFFLLLGAYPVLSFLWRRSYPFFTAEVFILFFGIVALSLLLVVVHSQIRSAIKSMLTTLVIAIVFLIQFNLQMEGTLVLIIVILPLAWVLDSRFYAYGLPVLLAMLIGAWIDSHQHLNDFDNAHDASVVELGKPPIIHILLDGFIGTDGLPPFPASPVFKNEIESFFRDYGFTVFPRAYSRYPLTGASLYAAMNFRNDGNNSFSLEARSRKKHVLSSNLYFDAFEDSGYRLNVYQTAHLNFCESNPNSTDKCWNYVHPNVLTVTQVPDSVQRAEKLAKVLLVQSFLLTKATYGLITDPAIAVYDSRAVDVLQEDLLANPQGRVFFAHLLLPHNPFVFLHDCSIRYESDPSLSYAMLSTDKDLSPEVIEYRTMRYFEQAECALVTLRQMFEKIKSRALFDQAYIVVHGDHGSQISRTFPAVVNLNNLTGEDYRAHYSTLFAVKFPFGKFSLDQRILPLSALLEEFSNLVVGVEKKNEVGAGLVQSVHQSSNKTAPFIYLTTPNGLAKVEVDIFRN